MRSKYHPHEISEARKRSFQRMQFIFLTISFLFIVCFWIWFLFIRQPVGNAEREEIEGRAITEILTACNATIPPDGVSVKFRRQDITMRKISPVNGVSPLVSMLEVSRNGFVCDWDGIGPAQISRARR